MQEGPKNIETNNTEGNTPCGSVFGLKRIAQNPAKFAVEVDFSGTKECDGPSLRPMPVFNKDNRYYTPSFILEKDESRLKQTEEHYLIQHNRKLLQNSEEKSEMFVPQPSKLNRYCCICKESYDDYLTHVNIPTHQKLLRKSSFCDYIEDLCRDINTSKKVIVKEEGEKRVKRRERKGKKGLAKGKAFQQTSVSGSSTHISICLTGN